MAFVFNTTPLFCYLDRYFKSESKKAVWEAKKRTGSGKRMILNDGKVDIVRKHYILNILTEVQRGKVNIKGRETGNITGTS